MSGEGEGRWTAISVKSGVFYSLRFNTVPRLSPPQFQLILMERCGGTFDVRAIRILMNRLARSR